MGSEGHHEMTAILNLDSPLRYTTNITHPLIQYNSKMCMNTCQEEEEGTQYSEDNIKVEEITSDVVVTEESSSSDEVEMDGHNNLQNNNKNISKWSSPGKPSYIAKDSNSITFQWKSSMTNNHSTNASDYKPLYHVELQQINIMSESQAIDKSLAIDLIDPESWVNICSVSDCWTQIRNLRPGRFYAVRVICEPIMSSSMSLESSSSSSSSPTASSKSNELSSSSSADNSWIVCPDPSPSIIFNTTSVAPIAPLPPCLADRENNSLKFKWNEPVETGGLKISEYRLEISLQKTSDSCKCVNNMDEFIEVYSGPDLQYTVENLEPGVKYAARVKAINKIGESPWSLCSCFKTKPAPPLKPVGLTTEITSQHSVFLEWLSCIKRGKKLNTYNIEVNQLENQLIKFICSGSKCNYDIKRLDSGIEYAFRIRAENEVGKSPWSDPIKVKMPCNVPEPPPMPFTNKTAKDHSIIEWHAPLKNGGSPVLSYNVEMIPISRVALDGQNIMWKSLYENLKEKTCIVNNLIPGCSYQVRVKAQNKIGMSMPSKTLIFTTAAGCPEKAQLPHAIERTSTSLKLNWAPPRHDGGKIIECYRLEICPAKKLNSSELSVNEVFETIYNGPKRYHEVNQLNPGEVYVFRVMALNACGSSDWSELGYESTTSERPFPPTSIDLISRTSDSVTLKWMPSDNRGEPIINYTVELVEEKLFLSYNDNEVISENDKVSKLVGYKDMFTECTLSNLKSNTNYIARIKSKNSIGVSNWSEVLRIHTPSIIPSFPENLRFKGLTSSEVVLIWENPRDPYNDYGGVEYYIIEYLSSNSKSKGKWLKHSHCTKNSIRINDLLQDYTYKFRVIACNNKGCGPATEPIEITTLLDVPYTPTDLICQVYNGTSIKVHWTPSSNFNHKDNHDKIVYLLQMCLDGGEDKYEDIYDGKNLSYQLPDMEPLTKYYFRVSARNKTGTSGWSSVASVLTQHLPPPCPMNIDIHPIMEIADNQNVQLKVSWSIPKIENSKCARIDGYEIEAYSTLKGAKYKKKNNVVCREITRERECILKGFKPKCTYHVKVRSIASNKMSNGNWSEVVMVKIPTPDIRYHPVSVPRELSEISAGTLSEFSNTSVALSGSFVNSAISSTTTDSDSVCFSRKSQSTSSTTMTTVTTVTTVTTNSKRNSFNSQAVKTIKTLPQPIIRNKSRKNIFRKLKAYIGSSIFIIIVILILLMCFSSHQY